MGENDKNDKTNHSHDNFSKKENEIELGNYSEINPKTESWENPSQLTKKHFIEKQDMAINEADKIRVGVTWKLKGVQRRKWVF